MGSPHSAFPWESFSCPIAVASYRQYGLEMLSKMQFSDMLAVLARRRSLAQMRTGFTVHGAKLGRARVEGPTHRRVFHVVLFLPYLAIDPTIVGRIHQT